ncbi:MAG: helix-turn-helix transcriptional regulator [Chloroflexi bacterium]|nr:helix-turn-helix transcriptional regulator [Chloroflexota bacterium]
MDRESRLYTYHAEMCKVFSHPKRLHIINALRQEELSVTELSRRTGTAMPNLSQHLTMMRERGILTSRKEGNMVYYRVADPKLVQAFDLLRQILFRQIEREGALIRGMMPLAQREAR